jgi:hypothetical protein
MPLLVKGSRMSPKHHRAHGGAGAFAALAPLLAAIAKAAAVL